MAISCSTCVIVAQAAVIAFLINSYFVPKQNNLKSYSGINESYDYIIVGAGSAGSTVAGRLSENDDVTVLLLEAGESDLNQPDISIPMAAKLLTGSQFDWHFYTTPQKHAYTAMQDKKNPVISGKVLGGSSSLNYMLYARGNRHDYDSWAANGCEGWSYDDVLPYFKKSEEMMDPELAKFDHHGTRGPMGVSRSQYTTLGDVFVEAGHQAGYNLSDYNDGNNDGFGFVQSTIKDGLRMSTSRAFIWPNIGRPNLHVAVKIRVTKVIIQNSQAVGVEYLENDRLKTVKARKEVILSAGSIMSPFLLMHSGIGPRKILEENQIPVRADLPVGENLQNHIMAPLRVFTKPGLSLPTSILSSPWNLLLYHVMKSGPMCGSGLEATGFVKTSPELKVPDIHLMTINPMLSPDQLKEIFNVDDKVTAATKWWTGEGFTIFVSLQHPKSVGTVRLSSSNPLEYPLIDPEYLSDPEDINVLIKGIRIVQKILKTKAFSDVDGKLETAPLSICSHLPFDTDEYWECYIRGLTLHSYHMSGTCKMGAADDKTSVVDPQLRVKGIRGLRVADASVFPTSITGNNNAPAIMVGEKAADFIKRTHA